MLEILCKVCGGQHATGACKESKESQDPSFEGTNTDRLIELLSTKEEDAEMLEMDAKLMATLEKILDSPDGVFSGGRIINKGRLYLVIVGIKVGDRSALEGWKQDVEKYTNQLEVFRTENKDRDAKILGVLKGRDAMNSVPDDSVIHGGFDAEPLNEMVWREIIPLIENETDRDTYINDQFKTPFNDGSYLEKWHVLSKALRAGNKLFAIMKFEEALSSLIDPLRASEASSESDASASNMLRSVGLVNWMKDVADGLNRTPAIREALKPYVSKRGIDQMFGGAEPFSLDQLNERQSSRIIEGFERTGLDHDAYNDWSILATIEQENLGDLSSRRTYEERTLSVRNQHNDGMGPVILSMSDDEKIGQYNALVEEFNEELQNIIDTKDMDRVRAFHDRADKLIRG